MVVRPMILTALATTVVLYGTAGAATYSWTDDQGVLNFTDNPERVPPRFLKRAKELPSMRVEEKASGIVLPPPPPPPEASASPATADGTGRISRKADSRRLREELQKLRDGLPAKREELARLRRKRTVSKGKVPSEKELKTFQEKQSEGDVSFEDNPYVGKSALNSLAAKREAYYKKFEDIRGDEARIEALQKELDTLER